MRHLRLSSIAYCRTGDRDPVDPALAEIGLDDLGVADDVVRLAGGDQPAMVEHGEMIDQLHHRLHRVLDDQDGDAVVAQLPDHAEDVVEIVMAEPGQGLVEQDQPGLRRQRAGQFHQPQLARRQPAGDRAGAGAEPDPVERGRRHLPRRRVVRAPTKAPTTTFSSTVMRGKARTT